MSIYFNVLKYEILQKIIATLNRDTPEEKCLFWQKNKVVLL